METSRGLNTNHMRIRRWRRRNISSRTDVRLRPWRTTTWIIYMSLGRGRSGLRGPSRIIFGGLSRVKICWYRSRAIGWRRRHTRRLRRCWYSSRKCLRRTLGFSILFWWNLLLTLSRDRSASTALCSHFGSTRYFSTKNCFRNRM
jgi:hypothetical protein